MYALYQDKRHASYDKRIKQDKIMEVMKDQILFGESMKRIMNEEKTHQKYIKDKEISDTLKDEKKRKYLKMQEIEAKRILDIQLQEKEEQKNLRKYEDNTDATFIAKEANYFTVQEKAKQDEMLRKTFRQQ